VAGSFDLSSDDNLFSDINVTPLVDVVLVLLIIFMITAPAIYQQAIKVQLPKAKSGEVTQTQSPLSFSLSQEGNLHWGKDAVDWKTLDSRLAALGPQAADQTALISADEATPHGTVIRLMDSLRTAGLTHFALSVDSNAGSTPGSPGGPASK
jgi:biopolymer transport protein ExbD